MNLLFDLGGIDILKDLVVDKQLEDSKENEESFKNLSYLFNIGISCIKTLPFV